MRRGVLLLLRLYQRVVSPLFPPSCRFYPTCSSYAMTAYHQCGVLKGTWLTLRRLLKCHPFHPGGYDPVYQHPTPEGHRH